jgi:hypothetical protein
MFTIMVATYRMDNEIVDARTFGTPYLCVCMPWDMIASHERQAHKNHSQTLERLNERGGLSACEALAVLEDREYRRMPKGAANHELCRKIADWIDEQCVPDPANANSSQALA